MTVLVLESWTLGVEFDGGRLGHGCATSARQDGKGGLRWAVLAESVLSYFLPLALLAAANARVLARVLGLTKAGEQIREVCAFYVLQAGGLVAEWSVRPAELEASRANRSANRPSVLNRGKCQVSRVELAKRGSSSEAFSDRGVKILGEGAEGRSKRRRGRLLRRTIASASLDLGPLSPWTAADEGSWGYSADAARARPAPGGGLWTREPGLAAAEHGAAGGGPGALLLAVPAHHRPRRRPRQPRPRQRDQWVQFAN